MELAFYPNVRKYDMHKKKKNKKSFVALLDHDRTPISLENAEIQIWTQCIEIRENHQCAILPYVL